MYLGYLWGEWHNHISTDFITVGQMFNKLLRRAFQIMQHSVLRWIDFACPQEISIMDLLGTRISLAVVV